jgi:transmembrane protein TMEM220
MQLARRVLGALGAAVFGVFAALQYNDPDAVVWIAIYGAACGVCVGAAAGRRLWPYALLVPGVALAWSLALLPAIMAQPLDWSAVFGPGGMMMAPGVEETREALGLLIAASWTAAVTFGGRGALARAEGPRVSP